MSKRAWIYVIFVQLLGVTLAILSIFHFNISYLRIPNLLLTFSLLTGLMTITQLFKSEAPTHQLFHPNLMFAMAGVITLPPFLFILMVTISHLVEWGKERAIHSQHLRDWYLQPFNISVHITSGVISQIIYYAINPRFGAYNSLMAVIAFLVASCVYTFLNHLFIGLALVIARGVSWRESGIFSKDSLSTDFIMLAMGFSIAIMMDINPLFFIPALAPLILIYRALSIPKLKKQASTDPKTGLWNAEHFKKSLALEFNRAQRNNRPMALIVADLDLLRNINNVYGHLGGDAVLIGVAQILKNSVRDYDIVSRFGGEEFAILMPETTPQVAYARVEKIRDLIQNAEFISPINRAKIKATMSFGIAGLKPNDLEPTEILHRADMAVYEAKIKGRNRTQLYSRDFLSNNSSVAQQATPNS